MYIRRDIVVQYKQTILGPLWYIIQPILTTIMYMFIFGGLAGISTDSIPQPLFYLSGIMLWNYFYQCFTDCSDVFNSNADVFGKVYFPRLVVPLASCSSGLLRLFIQLCIFIVVYCFYIFTPNSYSLTIHVEAFLLFPFILLIIGILGLSWGLIISSLTAKYRDLKFLVQFGIQLFMYATPIIYPLSYAPERYRGIINLNPLSSILEAFKYTTLGSGAFTISGLTYSLVVALLSLFVSLLFFSRTERNFMDTI